MSKPSIILVGNKSDIAQKAVSTDAAQVRAYHWQCADEVHATYSTGLGQQLAEKNGMLFIEASAKNAANVEDAFVNLVSEILQKTCVCFLPRIPPH